MPESLPPWPRPRTRPVLGCCSGWQWPRWWPTAMRSRRRGWPRATRPRGHLCVWPDAAGRLLGIPGGLGLCGRQDGIVCGDGVDGRLLCVARASSRGGRRRGGGTDRGELRRDTEVRLAHPVDRRRGVGGLDRSRGRRLWLRRCGPGATRYRCRCTRLGMLQAAGLLFFAFAGYARIATLGRRSATRPARSHAPSRWRWASPWRCMPWSPWP